jgi:hypothetical protein
MKQRLKDFLNRYFPPAVTAGWWIKRRLPIYLLSPFWLLLDTLKPGNFSQLRRFKKCAREDARLKEQRIKKFADDAQKFFLIITINHHNAGFFAYLTFVFNQLIYCEKHNYYPVVYFGRRAGPAGINAYYDPRYGGNMWDYYFEPVAGLTYDDVRSMIRNGQSKLKKEDVLELNVEELKYLHIREPDSVYAFPYGIYYSVPKDDVEWYKAQRARANRLIKKYIRIKKHIQDEIADFYQRHMKDAFIIGAHVRGTDKNTPGYADAGRNPGTMRIIEPVSYFDRIDPLLKQHRECKILVATDQVQYLDSFRSRYGDRIISYDSLRSKSRRNVFQKYDFCGYRKGKDVLIESQLLSRCQYFLKCSSAVGEAALWFNPKLDYTDMNYAA